MPRYRFLQPYRPDTPEPEYYVFRYRPEIYVAPGYGPPLQIFESELTLGFSCQTVLLERHCAETLRYFDEDLMGWVEPLEYEVDLCVIDNWDRCNDVVISPPADPGWISVQACGSSLSCSLESAPLPVSEPPVDALVWVALLTCLLGNAMFHALKR